jgi:HSP20 family molecular chaperone IbpA
MRYRSLTYRYALVATTERLRPLGGLGPLTVTLAQPRWRPDADVYETDTTIAVVVELGGLDEDDAEVTVFEDAVVVEGERRLACESGAVYHVASIRQGWFRLELRLPALVDVQGAAVTYNDGLLRVTLPKARRS